MRLIIAGSRKLPQMEVEFHLQEFTARAIPFGWPSEVVSGMCPDSPDIWGKEWAEGHQIPVIEFPADWTTFKKKAGFLRNEVMADYGDVLIAFWDGKSNGTKHMIQCMLNRGKPVHVEIIETTVS